MTSQPYTQVYRAANAGEGHLLQGLLEQHGIEVHISGESLAGGIGELPASALEVDLHVPADRLDEARLLIEQYEENRKLDGDWHCGECGETNPLSFELCWKCGKPKS